MKRALISIRDSSPRSTLPGGHRAGAETRFQPITLASRSIATAATHVAFGIEAFPNGLRTEQFAKLLNRIEHGQPDGVIRTRLGRRCHHTHEHPRVEKYLVAQRRYLALEMHEQKDVDPPKFAKAGFIPMGSS